MWRQRRFVIVLVAFLLEIPTATAATAAADTANAVHSPAVYRELRSVVPTEARRVENLLLKRDVGEILLVHGVVAFAPPVLDRVVCGVFVGEGEFRLTPSIPEEQAYLFRMTEELSLTERFDRLVLWFSDETYREVLAASTPAEPEARAGQVLDDLRDRLRRRTEEPRSFLEALVAGDDVENVEAEVLTDLLAGTSEVFDAYISGKRYRDLRFQIRARGVLPQLPSAEEVALIDVDPTGKREGIWYLAHRQEEYAGGRPDSAEDKRIIDVDHYRIETTLDGGDLQAETEIRFKTVRAGQRVLRFSLLPSLRVSSVRLEDGSEAEFVQEERKSDGAFYVVLPQPLEAGKTMTLKIAYAGDKVIEDAGGGNWSVEARSSWYPNVNAFNVRATFDLVFHFPKKLELVSVGRRLSEEEGEKLKVAHWASEIPIGVAGFNYGRFKEKKVRDEPTGYEVEGFAATALPDYLKGAEGIGGMSPSRLLDKALAEGQNSIRLYTHWFGPSPFGRIAITQQPQFSFGQSWPGLVYLPIVAFLDSTQRWQLLDGVDPELRDFVEEVTAHEVAHQWWGHLVGWASFHDQWLSEGLADFSASLYLESVIKGERAEKFWENTRKSILEADSRGRVANDAGPLSFGLRLNTYEDPYAYNRLVYGKGAFVVHMLRQMMFDEKSGDELFMGFIRSFYESHKLHNATTESFQAIVEQHMTPAMDLDGNGSMDWFFREWVYGTEIPNYELRYALEKRSDGKFLLRGTITQKNVSEDFKMLVPLYLELNGRIHRVGQANITGESSTPEFQVLLPARPSKVFLNARNDVLAREIRSTLLNE